LANLLDWVDRAARRGMIEGLLEFPRDAWPVRRIEEAAAGHVEADAVAEDMRKRLFQSRLLAQARCEPGRAILADCVEEVGAGSVAD
jgi:hypothetical protein